MPLSLFSKITGRIKTALSNAALVSAAIAAISVLALASALTAQYAFGLQPCELCLFQRVPYTITIVLGLTGLFFSTAKKNQKATAAIVFLSALVFAAGAAIAFYHSGVEQHWWVSFLEACKINFSTQGNLLEQIEAAPAVRCDEIPWADPLLHLSMASWNAIMSAGLAAGCFVSVALIRRQSA